MRILYDGDAYARQHAGGVNRYFAQIVAGLPHGFVPILTLARQRTLNVPEHPALRIRFWQRYGFRPGRLSLWMEKYYFRLAVSQERPDLAHPTYYTLLTRRPVSSYRCPVVITVWDMIHEQFRQQMDPDGSRARAKREAILAAQAVICISETTKRDLLDHIPVAEERVFVTHLAPGLDPRLPDRDSPVSQPPYYLYVGSRASYKNFDGLLRAMADARRTRPELLLRVVGKSLDAEERELMSRLKLEKHVKGVGEVTDEELAVLYRNSLALVYPSLCEGFGIPPLEAMACGTAVIAARAGSLPEVLGDAAAFFDPTDEDELPALLVDFHDRSDRRQQLIGLGRERAARYSWDRTVRQTVQIYRQLLQ